MIKHTNLSCRVVTISASAQVQFVLHDLRKRLAKMTGIKGVLISFASAVLRFSKALLHQSALKWKVCEQDNDRCDYISVTNYINVVT